ncbi:MAG: helix-turn-helix domain-containing protein [Bacteroidota bacterium]
MPELDTTSLVTFSVLVQCLFSIVYLSTYQWRRNKWLVLFFGIIFSMQLGVFTGVERLSFYQKLWMGNPGIIAAIIPSLYLFTKELVSIDLQNRSVAIHFLPAFIFYLVSLFYDGTQPRVIIAAFSVGNYQLFALFQLIAIFLINILYAGFILQLVQKNQQKYKTEYAESTIYLTLDWLKYLVIILVSLFIIAFLAIIFSQYFSTAYLPRFAVELVILFIILTTSYFAFRQPTLYRETNKVVAASPATIDVAMKTTATKAVKPLLTTTQIGEISARLDTYLLEKRPFLQPKIRMPEMAAAIDLTPNEFSWYLNEHKRTNFFTFINELRIDYAIQLLQDKLYEQYTLEAISKMSGFQSKTTFNNHFKEIKRVTPSAFRKEVRR